LTQRVWSGTRFIVFIPRYEDEHHRAQAMDGVTTALELEIGTAILISGMQSAKEKH